MLIDLNASRPEAGAHVPGVSEPLHYSSRISCHCGVINAALDCKHTRDPIEICEDWVHGNTEKKNWKESSHVNACDNHPRGQKLPCTLCLHLRNKRMCRVYIMIHKGALQAVKICKIQCGLMRSNALDRSKERTTQGRVWSSVVCTDCTALCVPWRYLQLFETDEAGMQLLWSGLLQCSHRWLVQRSTAFLKGGNCRGRTRFGLRNPCLYWAWVQQLCICHRSAWSLLLRKFLGAASMRHKVVHQALGQSHWKQGWT